MPTGVLLSPILSKLGRGRWASVVAQSHPSGPFERLLQNIKKQLSTKCRACQSISTTTKTHSKPPHSIAQTTTSQKPKPLGQIHKTPETQILFLPKDCHQRGCFGRVITITGPSLAPCHHRLMVALLEGREIGHGNWEGIESQFPSVNLV